MTTVTGIPTLPGATVRVRVDGPFYQRGDLAGPGQYVGTWDGASLKDDDGNVINIVMPRKDQGDPIISRDVIVFITYTFSGKRDFTQKLTYRPIYWVETSAGVFDLSTNPDPDVPQIATVEQLRRFSDLLAEGTALNAESTRLQADIAQTATDVQVQTDTALAQVRAEQVAVSLGREPQAGDPAGTYRVARADGIYVVQWSGAAKTGETLVMPTTGEVALTVPTIAAAAASPP